MVSVLERAGGAVAAVEKASIDEVYVDVTQAAQALLASLPSAVGDSSGQQQQQQQLSNLPCAVGSVPEKNEQQQQQLKKQGGLQKGELEQGEESVQGELEQQGGGGGRGEVGEQDLEKGDSEEASSSPKGGEGKRWEEIGEGGWAAVLAEATGTHVSEHVFFSMGCFSQEVLIVRREIPDTLL